jgi:copper chaperone
MEKLTIAIEGMTCGHCIRQVDGALRRLEGVQVQAVRVGEAFVAYDPTSVSEKEIAQAIHGLGYQTKSTGRGA